MNDFMKKVYIENIWCFSKDKDKDIFKHTKRGTLEEFLCRKELIMNKLTPSEIATAIKEGTWADVQEFNVLDFFKEIGEADEYVPNPEKMLQVRKIQINYDFINRQVTKVETTGDRSGLDKKGTVVFFPDDTEYEGIKIRAGSFCVGGGAHGTVISSRVGVLRKDYNLVNFKHDLDSNVLKLKRLGNKLNETFNENQGTENDDIKLEFWSLMDSRIENGECAKPTREEQDDFLNEYPQIKQAVTNWMAHHKEGGRRAATIQYTDVQLDDFKVKLSVMECYKDYNILQPMVLNAWNDKGNARVIIESERGLNVKPLDARQGKKKVLVPLWAKSATDMQRLEKGDIQGTIEDKYNTWCKHIGFDALEATFLPWK